MVSHPNIKIMLQTDYAEIKNKIPYRRMMFTGPIDEFFGFRLGKLPYRSLHFEHVTLDKEWHQPVAVVNYPQTEKYTRVTEYKHLTGQLHPKTSITYEYPSDTGDPYYPVPRPENQELYKRYEALASRCVTSGSSGRLATYRYYNMDQVVGQALATFRRIDQAFRDRFGRPPHGRGRLTTRLAFVSNYAAPTSSAPCTPVLSTPSTCATSRSSRQRGRVDSRRVAEHPEGRNQHPAFAIAAFDRQRHRLVNPTDDDPSVHPALEIHEIAAGDDELRDHAVEGFIDEGTAWNFTEAPAAFQPCEGGSPVAAPQGSVAVSDLYRLPVREKRVE